MATIANLNINLLANAATFNRVMNGAEKTMQNFMGVANGLTGKLAAIGAGVSVAGLVYFTHQQMEAIDASAKISDQLGIETEKFTELAYAARLAGVDTEQFGASLKKMSVNIAQPSAEAASAFAVLGLKIEQLQQMSPDEQLNAIADGLGTIKNQGERAAIAVDVFGKQGVKLLNTIQGGSHALMEAGKEAQAFGVAITRVDAAKIEAANDAISRVGIAVEGLAMQSAILLAPAIELAATEMTDFVKASGGVKTIALTGFNMLIERIAITADLLNVGASLFHFFRGAALFAISSIVDALATMAESYDIVSEKLTGFSTGIGSSLRTLANNLSEATSSAFAQSEQAYQDFESGLSGSKVVNWFADLEFAADKAAKAVADAMNKNKAAVSAFDVEAQKRAESVAKALEEMRDAQANFWVSATQKKRDFIITNGTDEQANEAINLADSLENMEIQKKAFDSLSQFATALTESTKTPLEKFADQLAKLDAALEGGLIDQETWNRGMEAAEDTLNKAERTDMGGATKLAAQESRFLNGYQTAAPTDPQARMAKDTADVKKNTQRSADALDALRQNQLVVMPLTIDG